MHIIGRKIWKIYIGVLQGNNIIFDINTEYTKGGKKN